MTPNNPMNEQERLRYILEKYFRETDLIVDQTILDKMNKGYSLLDQAITEILKDYVIRSNPHLTKGEGK